MNTKKRPMATCHPDRLHEAKGLCSACYRAKRTKFQRTRHNKNAKAWRNRNPLKVKEISLRYRYGLNSQAYTSLLAAKPDVCPICRKSKPDNIDHDHATGVIRGWLCGDCNRGLGLFDEDAAVLRRAIEYLENHVQSTIAA